MTVKYTDFLGICLLTSISIITCRLRGTMVYSNLVNIPLSSLSEAITSGHNSASPTPARPVQSIYRTAIRDSLSYTEAELLCIRDYMQHDRRYHTLDSAACVRIRELRLNKKRKRGCPGGQQRKQKQLAREKREKGVDHNNLINIPLTEQLLQHENKVNISTINARSVKSSEVIIKDHLVDNDIDICVISETWLKDCDQAWIEGCELNKDGFRMQTANRKARTGGGLACIYRERYKVDQKMAGANTSFEYALWLVRISDADYINVLGIYHPPPTGKNPPNSVFIDEASKFIAEEIMNLENIVILGDFNIRINDAEDNEVSAFSDTFHALGLDQHVNFPTHVHGNTLDLVFTENLSKIKVVECTQGPFLSDHCTISCKMSIVKSNIKRAKVRYRKLKNVSAKQLLDDMNIHKIMDSDGNIDELVELLNYEAQKSMDKHAPMKEKMVTQRAKNPWYSEDIREQKRLFRNRERVWKKYKTPETWRALKVERNKYKKMLMKSKRDTLKQKVDACGKDTKKLYKLVAELTGTQAENPLPPGKTDQELSEEFADFFISKITKIRDGLAEHPKYIPTSTRDIPQMDRFDDLSEEEVGKIIHRMATKSCESDTLPTQFIKEGIETMLPVITKLTNISLRCGVFATKWKTAIIRPLLKKANLELITSNYRPVSNLSFISKVVEKAALLRFNTHCEEHGLMPDYQSAYRANYSCETAVTKLMNDLLWSMENQEVSALAAIDLSAAFDTVDHDILLDILAVKFGIIGTALHWFDTYLRPRDCKVVVGGQLSTSKNLEFSVPQGSCAGPVLYLAYASTMQEIIPSSIGLYGYADDHALKVNFKAHDRNAEKSCINDIENCMCSIKEWMDSNRLKMNSAKTEFILFGNQRQLQKCSTNSINVEQELVKKTGKIKYLGVWLDETLSLKAHITGKCRTAMLNIQRLKLIRSSLSVATCKTLVQGLVISHLDYANAILAGLPNCEINKLQRVQNIAAKITLKKTKRDSATNCRKELHWLPIKARIDFKILVLVYRCLNNLAPDYLKSLIRYKVKSREGLRSCQNKQLAVPRTTRKTFADRSFSVYGPKVWNELPRDLQNCSSLPSFKKKLKTRLFIREYTKNI